MKSQKGITLIALIITIIVMLILVAVTITMAVNGGLFDQAQHAASETERVKGEEQNLASGYVNYNGQLLSINDIATSHIATPAE